MLWPLVLPFQITCAVLGLIVLLITGWAPKLKWRRSRAFGISILLALLAFVPSCTGVWYALAQIRFGYFEYATFDDINDLRAERYLPTAAREIQMHKRQGGNGYVARYLITEAGFHAYLDILWDEYGVYSAVARGEMGREGGTATREEMQRICSLLGCDSLSNAIILYSPTEADGGGATYFFDKEAGVVLQDTGYW
ncbi:hypothetical protein MalM25_28800 [Planctomycetes bacterium MalM25]|nr:hypothetical protein MalM25_28800 [Planctomycetes bacterium MalM25]